MTYLQRQGLFIGFLFCVGAHSVCIAQNLEDMVYEHTLHNGMHFLLVQRPGAPVFSAVIRFKVGSVDEQTGTTGIAHMFEHMAFKGTKTIGTKDYRREAVILRQINQIGAALSHEVGKGIHADSTQILSLRTQLKQLQEQHKTYIRNNEFFLIYESAGGHGMNASTGADFTTYYVSLPSNRLKLWMAMESERLREPVLREFYAERDVVMEERRMRTDTNPVGKLYEQLIINAFQSSPYSHPVVGWMSDLQTFTTEEAYEFYDTYYSPANACGALVGDIHIRETVQLLEEYFGSLPSRGTPAPLETTEQKQQGERRAEVVFRAEPQLMIGYHKPTLPQYDDFVFDVIDAVLSHGRTSRLYRALVTRKQLALSVTSYQGLPGARLDNLFVIHAVPRHPYTLQDVETAIYHELELLKTTPVSTRELHKVRNQIDANAIRTLESHMGLASQLTFFQLAASDWRYIIRQRETFKRITSPDIMETAQKYLRKDNRVVVTLVRPQS